MEKTTNSKRGRSAKSIIIRYWFFAFAVIFYLFFTAYYMGPSFTHCSDRIYGFGDSTAGPIWSNGIKPSLPVLSGYENSTNYPVGENLYSPVNYASVGQTLLMKTTSKVDGPVCGYNLMNITSYLATSLTMFAFIHYLTKKRWIALLAGYAVAFTPYVQSKIGGHPSYGFAALLIAALWLTLHLIKKKTLKYSIALAVVLAICAYFDPYFILLSGTIIAPLIGVWGIMAVWRYNKDPQSRPNTLAIGKAFLISLGVLMALLSPLAYIRIHDAKLINNSTSAVRGNVYATAQQCSNYPLDYLLPDPRNVYLMQILGSKYVARNISIRHWCGFGESRVSISLTAIMVVILGIIIFAWERLNKRRLKFTSNLTYDPVLLCWSLAVVGASALLLGLPPHVAGLIMPSDIVLKLTSTWRIFAREYLVVNLIVIILFSLTLSYFARLKFKWSKYILPLILVAIFVLIRFEYQITTPFLPLTFSYSQDTPQVYKQIRDDKSINAIAEYPLDRSGIEADSIVYYLTMQSVHKKHLFNSAALSNSRELIDISMKDLTDPQTLPALRYLGINDVVVHGYTKEYITSRTDQLQIIGHSIPPIYALTMVHLGGTNDIYLAKIIDGPRIDHILTIQKGYVVNLPLIQDPLNTEFEILQNTELKTVPLLNSKAAKSFKPACFDIKMSAASDTGDLNVSVNGSIVQTVPITGSYTHVEVMSKEGDTILLHNSKGYNMRLNNLGCSS
jgi:hypothetical protein